MARKDWLIVQLKPRGENTEPCLFLSGTWGLWSEVGSICCPTASISPSSSAVCSTYNLATGTEVLDDSWSTTDTQCTLEGQQSWNLMLTESGISSSSSSIDFLREEVKETLLSISISGPLLESPIQSVRAGLPFSINPLFRYPHKHCPEMYLLGDSRSYQVNNQDKTSHHPRV